MTKVISFLKITGLACMFISGALSAMNGHNNVVHNRVHKKAIIAGALIGAGIGFYIDRTLNPQHDANNAYAAGALYASFGGILAHGCCQVNFHGIWQRLPHIPEVFRIDTL